MNQPARITVADATRRWCADAFDASAQAQVGQAEVERAYEVLVSFVAARCRRHGITDPSTAEDVAHDVIDRLSRLPAAPDHPAAYLSKAVRNALVDRHRIQLREQPNATLPDVLADPAPPPADALAAEAHAARIPSVLAGCLEAELTAAEARRPGLGQRWRASLALLDTHADAHLTGDASAQRNARRHRQTLEDRLYHQIQRTYATSRRAIARLEVCPSVDDALDATPAALLDWLASEPPHSDALAFIEAWLSLLAFRSRFRLRDLRGGAP